MINDVGRYYLLYSDLMERWHRVLPGRVTDVQYEALVRDPEHELRNLLERLGDTGPAAG